MNSPDMVAGCLKDRLAGIDRSIELLRAKREALIAVIRDFENDIDHDASAESLPFAGTGFTGSILSVLRSAGGWVSASELAKRLRAGGIRDSKSPMSSRIHSTSTRMLNNQTIEKKLEGKTAYFRIKEN